MHFLFLYCDVILLHCLFADDDDWDRLNRDFDWDRDDEGKEPENRRRFRSFVEESKKKRASHCKSKKESTKLLLMFFLPNSA